MSTIVIYMIVNIISYFKINSAHVFDMYIIIEDIGTSESWRFFAPGAVYSASKHLFQKMKEVKNLILKTENFLTIKNKDNITNL